MEFFYSKSKKDGSIVCGRDDWKRILSAFWVHHIEYKGKKFASIEMAFHWEKFKRTDKPELGDIYILGGPFDNDPAKGKSYSGKGSMKKLGCTLDVKKWGVDSKKIMWKLIVTRAIQDQLFTNIIMNAPKPLLHFERNKKPIYGCYRCKITGELYGENYYGKCLERLSKELK